MNDLFSYNLYKSYMIDFFASQKRGIKSDVCLKMGIHTAYLSQVLNGNKDFTLEQLERFGDYREFSEIDMEYWMVLSNENKAGTTTLKKHYNKKISELKKHKVNVGRRLGKKSALTLKAQSLYFSSWIYPAIYMSLDIPQIKTPRHLANYLGLSIDVVHHSIEKLIEEKLILSTNKGYEKAYDWIRLEKDSILITQLHSNLRIKAAQKVVENKDSELHYSSYMTLSKADFELAKEIFLNSLSDLQKLVAPSKEEMVAGLCIDFFEF